MFNHARTLLLNMDAGSAAQPGEEAVPSGFKTLVLPTYLTAIRAILFGTDPDKAVMNYRLRQYMTVLHATDLAQYVTDLDPRITYLPFAADLYAQGLAAPFVMGILTGGIAGFIQGSPVSADGTGKMRFEVQVEATPDHATVTQIAPRYSVTTSNDLSNIPLGDSGYSLAVALQPEITGVTLDVRSGRLTFASYPGAASYAISINYGDWVTVHSGDEITVAAGDHVALQALNDTSEVTASGDFIVPALSSGTSDTVIGSWGISGFLPVARDLTQILNALQHVGEPVLLSLFGAAPAEPYATFRKLFTDYDQLVYRLGGLLLAVAYRTDEVRRAVT